jgi:hypothetical protein
VVVRSEDGGGPEDHHSEAAGGGGEHLALAQRLAAVVGRGARFQLGEPASLVHRRAGGAGRERVDRAHVDEARDARRQACRGHVARALDVGAQDQAVRVPGDGDARRQVEHRARAGHQRAEGGRIEHVPAQALHREPLQGADVVPHQGPYRVPLLEEGAHEVRAEVAGGAGDRGDHAAIIACAGRTGWPGQRALA